MFRDRLNGTKAEAWFKRFTEQQDVDYKGSFQLENLIRLLSKELPKRLDDGVRFDESNQFPDGEAWVQNVLFGTKKLPIPNEEKQNFSKHLLDQVASTDTIIELPGKDDKIERIAVDVTINPEKGKSKIDKIRGLPDPYDNEGQNRNRNIGKVRRELGITKHIVVVLHSERALLPRYDHLLSELKNFAKSNNKLGIINLRSLSPELTISGDYSILAQKFGDVPLNQKLQTIANTSIDRNDHPGYTVQLLLNDSAIKKINDFQEAVTISAKFTQKAVSRTAHYQIARSIEHILDANGLVKNGEKVFDQGHLSLKEKSGNYQIFDKNDRGLIFQSDRAKCKVNKLNSKEKLKFVKYYNNQVVKPSQLKQRRGPRR